MPPPGAPKAYEVSFPSEARERQHEAHSRQILSQATGPVTQAAVQKRRRTPEPIERNKRSRDKSPARSISYYKPPFNEMKETDDLRFLVDDVTPHRSLTKFTFFNPQNRQLAPLNIVGQRVSLDIAVAGFVSAGYENLEDEGQEDGDEEDVLYFRLGVIQRVHINYKEHQNPVLLETKYGWYRLDRPSKEYNSLWMEFWTPLYIAQLAFASLKTEEYSAFLKRANTTTAAIQLAIPHLLWMIEDESNVSRQELSQLPVLQTLIKKWPTSGPTAPRFPPPVFETCIGSPDRAVLIKENQHPTHVTSYIAFLAQRLYQENFVVVEKRLEEGKRLKLEHTRRFKRVKELVRNVWENPEKRCKTSKYLGAEGYAQETTVNGVKFAVGNIIAIKIGKEDKKPAPIFPYEDEIPDKAFIGDYFWIAKIIWMKGATIHVQWFLDGNNTSVKELADPNEIFLTEMCSSSSFEFVAGKLDVKYLSPSKKTPSQEEFKHDFFYRHLYEPAYSRFRDIPPAMLEVVLDKMNPNTCRTCNIFAEFRDGGHADSVETIDNGKKWDGTEYHIGEFVLIRAREGPARIGQILEFPGKQKHEKLETVRVRLLGRISNIVDIFPDDQRPLKDERHLFFTDEEWSPPIGITTKCFIATPSRRDNSGRLGNSIAYPHEIHFYAKWFFPTLSPSDISSKRDLTPQEEGMHCDSCWDDTVNRIALMNEFEKSFIKCPRRVLDLFGGCGGFGIGFEKGTNGTFVVQDAVDISPSMCATYKANSPHTRVHNQCANLILKALVRRNSGKKYDALDAHNGSSIDIESLPRRGQLDMLLASFPCQPHSRLNRFQVIEDQKGNLILTTLSFVDELRPKQIIFENVRGFLSSKVLAQENNMYRVNPGEIEMGQLKLVERALLDREYQVSFSLLQGGHYGIPQGRVRFFLMAALRGLPLPEFPQPTHNFPVPDALAIKIPSQMDITPIYANVGTAPYAHVSIEDSIGDLPMFDWKDPDARIHRPRKDPLTGENIKIFECVKGDAWNSGFEGVVPYRHEPRTTYQQNSREVPTTDLQQYTRLFIPRKVQQVICIPLKPEADYRDIPERLQDWGFLSTSSAIGRAGYRTGYFRRLDNKMWFNTVITNVAPTAKQSKVLHPMCLRIVTVRELARSQGFPDNFVFVSLDNDVIMMHRQIGNAVPIPLAAALGYEVFKANFETWKQKREDAIVVD